MNAAELSRSNVTRKKRLPRFRKTKISLSSGESETRSCSWLSSKKRRKTDREQKSCPVSFRRKLILSKKRPSKSSKRIKTMLSRHRHSSTSKRSNSILTLKKPSPSGKARARTLSPSLWSLRITRSALLEDMLARERTREISSKKLQ